MVLGDQDNLINLKIIINMIEQEKQEKQETWYLEMTNNEVNDLINLLSTASKKIGHDNLLLQQSSINLRARLNQMLINQRK